MRYRERLSPSAGVWLALSLAFPMLLLSAMPFGLEVGITVSIGGTLLLMIGFYLLCPVITVGEKLMAGRFSIPLDVIGRSEPLNSDQLKRVIGTEADARAQLLIRGYIKTALKIQIQDPSDPTPYIVVSTRRPEELAVALLANRS